MSQSGLISFKIPTLGACNDEDTKHLIKWGRRKFLHLEDAALATYQLPHKSINGRLHIMALKGQEIGRFSTFMPLERIFFVLGLERSVQRNDCSWKSHCAHWSSCELVVRCQGAPLFLWTEVAQGCLTGESSLAPILSAEIFPKRRIHSFSSKNF